jgi:hypothetical protein
VRLIGEANVGRDVGEGLAGKDTIACGVEPSAQDVDMRRDPELRRE